MIRLLEYALEAFDTLMRNKARTLLTMLGIFIGVGAVDAVYALSTGAATAISGSVQTSNLPSLSIQPDPAQPDPTIAALHYRDAYLLQSDVGAMVNRIVPFYTSFSGVTLKRQYSVKQPDGKRLALFAFSWHGPDPDLKVIAGRSFTKDDVDAAANVTLLSPDLAYQLYHDYDASIGHYLELNGTRFKIAGVTDKDNGIASNFFGGQYYFVLPYSTFHNFAPGDIDGLYVWTSSVEQETAARDAILAVLRHTHGAVAKFSVQSFREQLQQQDKILNIIAVSLTAIGAISLFVAGIGIMNIMLVSVTERTREIGIRKSIGAKPREIVLQFLIEASLMALAGGFAGLGLAIVIILLAKGFLQKTFGAFVVPYATIVMLAFLFSIIVGVVFGVYPAFRASRLDPVEAIRT